LLILSNHGFKDVHLARGRSPHCEFVPKKQKKQKNADQKIRVARARSVDFRKMTLRPLVVADYGWQLTFPVLFLLCRTAAMCGLGVRYKFGTTEEREKEWPSGPKRPNEALEFF